MFAGLATGGIPGRGSDRSATGLATCQVEAACDAERAGVARTAFDGVARVGADTAGCDAGRKTVTPITTAATSATAATPDHTRRFADRLASQLTFPMPILPCTPRAGIARRVLVGCESESSAETADPLPESGGNYTPGIQIFTAA